MAKDLMDKVMFNKLIMFVAFSLYATSIFAKPTEVLLREHSNDIQYFEYDEVPRVDKVILDVLQHRNLHDYDINWLGAALYDISEPYSQQRSILSSISEQSYINESKLAQQWEALYKQLSHWQYAQRFVSTLDPDITRINKDLNPKIPGKWLLCINSSTHGVWVLGGVHHPGFYGWKNRTDVGYYLNESHTPVSDVQTAYVVQPDGSVEHHTIKYWKPNFKEIAPGAIIYIPMPVHPSSLHPQNTVTDLNKRVINLLINRII